MSRRWLAAFGWLLAVGPVAAAQTCGGDGVAVQVLGSGGPELQGGRAASGYVVWIDGKARALVDVGPGVALRFAESGGRHTDLDVILLSQTHVDRAADLPALIQSSWRLPRKRPLPLFGPEGRARTPSTVTLVRTLFDGTRGAYRHLGDLVSPRDRGPYKLRPLDVPVKTPRSGVRFIAGFGNERLRTASAPVAHDTTPTLAWQVTAGGKRIVFGGDANDPDGLVQVARGADLAIVHHPIPATAAQTLSIRPPALGRIAAEAGVKQLVLSHRTTDTLGHEAKTLDAIGRHFRGPVSVADDLACYRP